jgi:hypothetical protein
MQTFTTKKIKNFEKKSMELGPSSVFETFIVLLTRSG